MDLWNDQRDGLLQILDGPPKSNSSLPAKGWQVAIAYSVSVNHPWWRTHLGRPVRTAIKGREYGDYRRNAQRKKPLTMKHIQFE